MWLHYATLFERIVEKKKLKLFCWKSLVFSVQADSLTIPHKGSSFVGEGSLPTEGAGSQVFWVGTVDAKSNDKSFFVASDDFWDKR